MIHRIVSCIEYLCFRRIKRYRERELQTKTRGGKEKLFGSIFIPLKQHKNHKTFYYVFYLFFFLLMSFINQTHPQGKINTIKPKEKY